MLSATAVDASAQAISSITRTIASGPMPSPPVALGRISACTPSATSSSTFSRGKRRSRSYRAARSTNFLRARSRTAATSSCSSGVIGIPLPGAR